MTAIGGLATALALLAVGAPQAQGPWIVTCNFPQTRSSQSSVPHQRVFRIGRKVLQEWNSAQQRFGPNLCLAYSCTGDANQLQGVISSPTLILTLSLEPKSGAASWRSVGAANLGATSGSCSAKVDTAGGQGRQ